MALLKAKADVINFDQFFNKMLDLADKAAQEIARETGEVLASNFKEIAAKDWTHVPEPSISAPFESSLSTWSVDVVWGAPGSVPSQLSSGEYEPVLPEKNASEPVSVSLVNVNASARFFPSRAGSKMWSNRVSTSIEPKPRNYDLANVNYLIENQQNIILNIVNSVYRKTFR